MPPGTVEIYRIRELPAILQTALPAVIRGLAATELEGKQYDQGQKHKVEKYVRLPDPTLKDLGRMKSHQVRGLPKIACRRGWTVMPVSKFPPCRCW